MKIIGERIKAARLKRGLYQREIGFHREVISRFETGSQIPGVRAIVRLAKVLGVSADYLLGLSEAA